MKQIFYSRMHTFVTKASIFLFIAAFVMCGFVDFLGSSDIPVLMRWLYGLCIFAWFFWTLISVLDHNNQAEREKSYYIFSLDKASSVSCRHPSREIFPAPLKISEFMDAYNMSVYDFENQIVRHGVQMAIQEYVDQHPDELVYTSPSFD